MSRRRPSTSPARVLLYSRVSTEEQADSGLGLDAQRAALDTAAGLRGWGDVEHVADEGYSAKSLRRPGMEWALAELAEGRASALVAAKLDRFSRSVVDFAGLMEQAQREGWALVALDSPVDMTTPHGRMIANVMATFAQFERELIGQRTKDALAVKKRAGVRLGRPRLVPDAVVARIVDERAAGASLRAIAAGLNDAGVASGSGGRWHPQSVAVVLRGAALDAEAEAIRARGAA